MERPWPLTGRDEALRTAAAALRPGAAGIVVAGPAGVGKTRLAREAVALREQRGATVVWVHGTEAARPLPLGAFAGLLDVPVDQGVASLTQALQALARQRQLVLAVDDAHLLDELSALVLHRVVLGGLGAAVVTVRSGQPAPDVVRSLWKDQHLARLDLDPLDADESVTLLARVLGGPVESAAARRLWALSEGIPLFLRHLVAGEVAAGRLSAALGMWRWDHEVDHERSRAADRPVVSAELADLLEREIGALAPGVRDVVDLVALAEPLPLAALSTLAPAADLEEAETRGLVRLDGRRVRLAHPLYGEVRRAAMGSLRARRLRGRVARSLADLDGETDPIARAVLTLDSDLPADPELFLTAARAATAVFDLPLAERLARAAAATEAPDARLVHAATLSWLTRGEEAETILRDLAARTTSAELRAMAHVHRAGNLLFTMARAEDADRAVEAAEGTGALPLHVAGMSLALASARGDVAVVLRDGPPLLRRELPDDLARILVASAVSAAAALSCDAGLLDEAARVGGLTGDRVPTTVPGFGLADLQVLGHRLAGTPGLGAAQARRIHAASADLPAPARLMGLVVAGHAALAEGLLQEALSSLREAWSALSGSDHEFRFRCRTLLSTALAQSGQTGAADGLPAHDADQRHPAYRLHEPDELLAQAWASAVDGSTSRAAELARAAAELACSREAPGYEVLAWQTAVQLGDADTARTALPRLAALSGLSPRAGLAHAHARARDGDDGGALQEAAQGWARLGDLVAAGDAAAQAAEAHRRRGRQGSALSATASVSRLSARSGARTPAVRSALRPLPLTTREREVVELAAHGLTNRAIAERLTLSVRTVEGHLYRAGLKLGVSERGSLAGLVADE